MPKADETLLFIEKGLKTSLAPLVCCNKLCTG